MLETLTLQSDEWQRVLTELDILYELYFSCDSEIVISEAVRDLMNAYDAWLG